MGAVETATTTTRRPAQVKDLSNAFQDKELALFFTTWLKNNRNATKTYAELHPEYNPDGNLGDYHTCATLGSRMLKKVDISSVLEAYGLNIQLYIKVLQEGLWAESQHFLFKSKDGNNVFTNSPDHKSRRMYHRVLGDLLGIEKVSPNRLTQVKIDNLNLNSGRSKKNRLQSNFPIDSD